MKQQPVDAIKREEVQDLRRNIEDGHFVPEISSSLVSLIFIIIIENREMEIRNEWLYFVKTS